MCFVERKKRSCIRMLTLRAAGSWAYSKQTSAAGPTPVEVRMIFLFLLRTAVYANVCVKVDDGFESLAKVLSS